VSRQQSPGRVGCEEDRETPSLATPSITTGRSALQTEMGKKYKPRELSVTAKGCIADLK